MDVNVRCQALCSNTTLTKEESAVLGKRIRNNYYVHLYVNISISIEFIRCSSV